MSLGRRDALQARIVAMLAREHPGLVVFDNGYDHTVAIPPPEQVGSADFRAWAASCRRRALAEAARRKALGRDDFRPHLTLHGRGGRSLHWWVLLPGGKLSQGQRACGLRMAALGHVGAVVWSEDEARAVLRDWGGVADGEARGGGAEAA